MSDNRYLNLDFSDITTDPNLSRREFLKTIGGGIVIFFLVGDSSVLEAQRGRSYPEDFNAYLRIGPDGRVSCFTGKIEMGQGVVTSLAQMLADELDVSLDAVAMVMGDTAQCPWDMGTFGSMSTRFFGPPLRAAGAEARSVLIQLASEKLGVPQDRLTVEDGVVFDKSDRNKRVTYADLAQGQTITRRAQPRPSVKRPSEFKVMGKGFSRRDAIEKVTGKAKYAGDIRVPGMMYARILRPPAHGATLKSVDTSDVERIEGASVVRDGDLIAVLHKNWDVAGEALSRISAEFDVPQTDVNDETIFDHLLASAGNGNVVAQGGQLDAGEAQAEITIEQTFLDGYKAHAPMETHTAVAQIEDGKATIWASTQTPFPIRDQIARAIGFSPDDVRVITPFVGGGFGGKSPGQQAIEAARLAKASGKPVQVMWTREEEFFYDTFRPAAVVKVKSGATKDGKIVLWDYNVYFAGSRGAEHFYDIPNHRTTSIGGGYGGGPDPHPFATGAWRAPANNTNTFARESQIDMMAAQAKIDPVEFRLKNLKDERMIRTLKAAAEKFGWTAAPAPSGRGVGVACGIDAGTYVATIAQADVDKRTGRVQVKRIVSAQDMGLAVNPRGATIQMEGCITMGLGYALMEDIHFRGGRILDRNFDTYQLPRFSHLPRIETVILDLQDEPAQGGGEPAIIVMGAVVANAVYDAVGARVLQLPISTQRVRQAIAAAANDMPVLA
ncbi:MAG: xanthine dehydrogenase family protein molybdopterin-binding subunit [Sedimentisphaerales bacterium]|nr:xanthine dehydrogenase family protein molybdopterin-binding subunit [Sedimentisphaerales bacterium]